MTKKEDKSHFEGTERPRNLIKRDKYEISLSTGRDRNDKPMLFGHPLYKTPRLKNA